ncbi:ABC transporter ATP-binding protein [Gelria sp. Kuro-4]|uniref:ABC transporter ATP-binding protein n=1 Tax=Gelria sp. Kuro-4 TaxID=2796927 RepID=UPI001BF0C50B|nr:ABC transporter ATP-binding protein [Gelria sp. Kuro-4]BCV24580.1 multidrug ABC transporter ATP-binding protein [Gelria sp. Kuro-4]
MAAIETFALTKEYVQGGGCRDVSLTVGRREIFGLLGPNGAGKSTLVKTLVGLLKPTGGRALILGRPLGDLAARRRIGFLPESFAYQPWLSARELLAFHGALAGLSREETKQRSAAVLDLVGLREVPGRIGTFSKGMRQRLGLACALVADPELVFLDEPTSALDPLGRRAVRELLLRLKAQGKTVFLNSHLLSEVELICDRVAVIKGGAVIYQGELSGLLAGARRVELKLGAVSEGVRRVLATFDPAYALTGRLVTLNVATEQVPALVQALVAAGAALYEVKPAAGTLEDAFVELVGTGGGGADGDHPALHSA